MQMHESFLSTLPARGATGTGRAACARCRRFLSTLPARGATRRGRDLRHHGHISIHAPREGSDPVPIHWLYSSQYFYPRSPRGERPAGCTGSPGRGRISIHAPREGSDLYPSIGCIVVNISIHAPREGSDYSRPNRTPVAPLFLSTLPARGATWWL